MTARFKELFGDMLSIEEVAKRLGVHTRVVTDIIDDGRLPALWLAPNPETKKVKRIPEKALMAFLDNKTVEWLAKIGVCATCLGEDHAGDE